MEANVAPGHVLCSVGHVRIHEAKTGRNLKVFLALLILEESEIPPRVAELRDGMGNHAGHDS